VKPGWLVEHLGALDVPEALGKLEQAGTSLGRRRIAQQLWAAAQGEILGEPGSSARAVFRDEAGNEVALELERKKRDVTAHEFGTALPVFYLEARSETLERSGKRVGLIHFTNWFPPMMKPIDEAIDRMRGYDGLVLDLRGNTGGAGIMVMGVAGHFFEKTTELGVMRTRETTLNIVALPRRLDSQGKLVQPYTGPLAILIDETTGSASEMFAGGMQSVGRARVFGETSAGAVLPAMTTPLPNGDVLLHALGEFDTAAGKSLEGVGVVPDVAVPLKRADLLAGHDASLEAAVDWIVSYKGS
jgi:carboxyl-terminal processing protease